MSSCKNSYKFRNVLLRFPDKENLLKRIVFELFLSKVVWKGTSSPDAYNFIIKNSGMGTIYPDTTDLKFKPSLN